MPKGFIVTMGNKRSTTLNEDPFLPYRKRYTQPSSSYEKRSTIRQSTCCITISAIFIMLSILAVLVGLVFLNDRIQKLREQLDEIEDRPLIAMTLLDELQSFRGEHTECFRFDRATRLFVQPNSSDFTTSVTTRPFILSGYYGVLRIQITSAGLSYLAIKYGPTTMQRDGAQFPMKKLIFIELLNPKGREFGIQKLFNTQEEIQKGAKMFEEPNDDVWGTNFCSLDLIDRFVNNNFTCVTVRITET